MLLALLVTVGVMWRLHFTGIAKTNEVYCGLEEHIHTDDCYAWVLEDDGEEFGADASKGQAVSENNAEEAVGTAEAVSGTDQTSTENASGEAASTETGSVTDQTSTENASGETAGTIETGTGSEEGQVSSGNTSEAAAASTETDSVTDQTSTENASGETAGTIETGTGSEESPVSSENTSGAAAVSTETASVENQTMEEITSGEAFESTADTGTNSASGIAEESATDTGTNVVSGSADESTSSETGSVLGVNVETGEELAEMVLLTEATQTEEWYLSHGYVLELVCGMEEHIHTVECLSDDTADVETASDWEATLPGLTGDRAFDVVAMAQSQLGYTESARNFILDEDGTTWRGYTRYGAWYGNKYGNWNAMFAAFCLYYAGVDEEEFPVNSGAYAWAVQLKELGAYGEAAEYDPAAGGLVFFDTDSDEKIDRVGIVVAVDELSEILTVIEGDYTEDEADAVCSNTYAVTDSRIAGYGILPASERAEDETDTEETGEESSETLFFTASDSGVSVTVTAPVGALPENAVLAVSLLGESSLEYAAAAEAVGHDSDSNESGMAALDITFYDELGMEIEPTEAVTVSVDISSLLSGDASADTIEVSHIIETDTGTELSVTVDTVEPLSETVTDDTDETAVVIFETESFSKFTLRWTYGGYSAVSITATTYLYGTNTTIGNGSTNINTTSGNAINLTSSNTSLAINGYTLVSASVTYNGTTYDDIVSIVVTVTSTSYGWWQTSYTYTYVCTDSNGETYELYEGSSTTNGISVNLYYTANGGSGGSTGTTIYVWYDRVTVSGTTLTGQNDSTGIDSVTLDASTVPQGDSRSSNYRNSTTGLAIANAYSTAGQTVAVTVTPATGYYVTFISINCCGGGAPTSCDTYKSGDAFSSNFTVSTTGAITVDVTLDSEKGFHHDSESSGYFILIGVATIPSPLYVEYDYGDIVALIGDSTADSAFSTANGWTTGTDGNYYGNGYSDSNGDGDVGIKTAYTQYKYAYTSNSSSEAANWTHYANTITDEAKAQAVAAGYVFAGWKAEYYTSVTVTSRTPDADGYQYAYNNWDYTFATSYGDNTYDEGDQVALTTNVRMIAQWVPIGVTIEKVVEGLSGTDYAGTSRTYTVELQKLDTSSGTEIWETYKTVSLSVTGDGSASEIVYPLSAGTYRVVETGGNDTLTSNDGSTTYYIGVSTTGEVTISSMSYGDYTETTAGSSTVLLADTMTVTNTYDDEPVVVDVILKKVDDNGNTLSDAVFTLTDSSGNTITYTTGSDGTITMKELRVASSYILTETRAPDGYNLISGDVPFTVKSDGVSFDTTVDEKVITTYVDSGGDIIIEVVNTVGAEMPSTGGGGTQMYTLVGFLLISSAACLLYRKQKANARGGGTSDQNL